MGAAHGSIYAWGRGLFGRLGVGVLQDEFIPTLVEIGVATDDDESSQISFSGPFSVREDSRSGLLQDRDAAQRTKVTQVAAGAYHSLALTGPTSCLNFHVLPLMVKLFQRPFHFAQRPSHF